MLLQLANDAGKLRLDGASGGADEAGKPPPDMQLLLACAVSSRSIFHLCKLHLCCTLFLGGKRTVDDNARQHFSILNQSTGQRSSLPCSPAIPCSQVEISSAMHYLHGRGMLHGDLTCNNILLVEDAADPRGFRTKVSPAACC